jgi:uncharacterized 2Fe-2S/4Fe-4S cluster protein (DUF4445 family)
MTRLLGMAFDAGTTNVRGALVDLESGRSVAEATMPNPQSKYGKNVISRIAASGKRRENLFKLKREIWIGIHGIARDLLHRSGETAGNVEILTFVANPTIGHLLMGEDPGGLGVAPHIPAFVESRTGLLASLTEGAASDRAANAPSTGMNTPFPDLGSIAAADAIYYLAPSIGGHVGSDILAGMIATGMAGPHIPIPEAFRQYVYAADRATGAHTAQKALSRTGAAADPNFCGRNQLLIDMGTNGEIVLRAGERFLACSTAAGPAFESAGARGSNAIVSLSSLLGYGAVDREGLVINAKIVAAAGMTQDGIRLLQLAKAAIRAGIETLMEKLALTPGDLDDVFVTGNFGNGLNADAVQAIGLLPRVDTGVVSFVPDAALHGAALLLASERIRTAAEAFAPLVTHAELAGEARFQAEYIARMNF